MRVIAILILGILLGCASAEKEPAITEAQAGVAFYPGASQFESPHDAINSFAQINGDNINVWLVQTTPDSLEKVELFYGAMFSKPMSDVTNEFYWEIPALHGHKGGIKVTVKPDKDNPGNTRIEIRRQESAG